MTDLRALSEAHFAPHEGETFRVDTEDGTVDAELIDVLGRGGDTVEDAQRAPFSLVFRFPGDDVLEQRIFHLEHETLGPLDLFLVPIGPAKGGGMRYEAVFS